VKLAGFSAPTQDVSGARSGAPNQRNFSCNGVVATEDGAVFFHRLPYLDPPVLTPTFLKKFGEFASNAEGMPKINI
jgi:hypothetical protein